MKITEIAATVRPTTSSSSAGALRREKKVPGVLYGLNENIHFSVNAVDLRKLIYTADFGLVDLQLDGKTHRCLVKDYQRHPVTDAMQHVDFLALQPGRKVKVDLPVHFVGIAPGVKAGGTVVKKLRKVKVKTTPENLVPEFAVDISGLELGQSVRVRDIETGEGVEVLNPAPMPLATIEIPRALKAAAAEAEAEAEAAAEAAAAEGIVEEGEEGAAETPKEGES